MENTSQLQDQLQRAAELIRSGGAVAFPTETVYGLGANALDAQAAARIFEIKRRPHFDPLIVHVAGKDRLDDLVTDVPNLALDLIDKLWPGPLTLVLPKRSVVPDIVTSGLPGVAVRVPSNEVARKLIELAGVPVAAPSANPFGCVSPTTAEHVREGLGNAVDMIIDGGECTVGVESTIISFMTDVPTLLRPGGMPLDDIEAIIGDVTIPNRNEHISLSPGRCEQHYATSVPLIQVDDIGDIPRIHTKSVGLLTYKPLERRDSVNLPTNVIRQECLSQNGDLNVAACNLFAAMRRLDASGVNMIVALPVPNNGLGMAINDRLYRASKK